MLDVADKLGSVLSTLIGLIGVVLTAHGLRLQRRAHFPPPAEPPAPPIAGEPTSRLDVPARSDWVPDARFLPPGGSRRPGPEDPPSYGSAPETPAGSRFRRRPARTLVVGLGMIVAAIVIALLTVLF